jgi:hypothetical protein
MTAKERGAEIARGDSSQVGNPAIEPSRQQRRSGRTRTSNWPGDRSKSGYRTELLSGYSAPSHRLFWVHKQSRWLRCFAVAVQSMAERDHFRRRLILFQRYGLFNLLPVVSTRAREHGVPVVQVGRQRQFKPQTAPFRSEGGGLGAGAMLAACRLDGLSALEAVCYPNSSLKGNGHRQPINLTALKLHHSVTVLCRYPGGGFLHGDNTGKTIVH